MDVTANDSQSIEQLLSVAPAWSGMPTAADAIGLETHTLLHCGPPADPHNALVTPTLNSAAIACVYEGWAGTLDEADELIESGEVHFEPAQDRNVATPMAAVVSQSMRMIEISDLNNPSHRAYAPINGGGTGGDPAARYGRKTKEALDLIRFLNNEIADVIDPASIEPLPWLPIVDEALTDGDDVHLRHVAAHGILLPILKERLGTTFSGSKSEEFIAKWPGFHLNFWMAASRCILAAANNVKGSGIITAFGGNGTHFGLQVSGLPGRWFSVEASPPLGVLREPHTLASCVGAYGDSALIEGLGLGAMAQAYCPFMQDFHKDFNHNDILELPGKLLAAEHPGFPKSRVRVGLSAHAVIKSGATPIVELGIVDKEGIDGGLGAGLYRPPTTPFAEACNALAGNV